MSNQARCANSVLYVSYQVCIVYSNVSVKYVHAMKYVFLLSMYVFSRMFDCLVYVNDGSILRLTSFQCIVYVAEAVLVAPCSRL